MNLRLSRILHSVLVLSLMSAVSINLQAQAPDNGKEVEQHLTGVQEASGEVLLSVLRKNHAYTTIKHECLLLEFEEETKDHFLFAVRFDQSKCGGSSPSNLIDRFAVKKHSRSVRYYDPGESNFRSFKWFLKHRNW